MLKLLLKGGSFGRSRNAISPVWWSSPSRILKKPIVRFHSSTITRTPPKSWTSPLKLFGLALCLGTAPIYYTISQANLIRNENGANVKTTIEEDISHKANELIDEFKKSDPEERKILYRQLCLGSIFGIVTGFIMVKISGLLVYVTVCGLLGFEWLKNRRLINVSNSQFLSFTKGQLERLLRFFKVNLNHLDLFKISFISSLLLTYMNS
ncbi:hypothetical protein KAFR_0K00800 [Kazachstania africana CBS 2517]|uniref:FUN14 domain-containing protein n=1 Tax=Kazachstania africana (strain ATCC 22294 / BCRC 22015 / CBS 2517 / CECT 1963 / NBRC 1671 / NRRL Y-8276) TaxID=1071382 RepID=H2B1D5_KAZAF|nr:hypothetical protein KAFR_0K00800 [Kazachstania africana CBS 2517]CCF60435.1 hypothetical protein KAFR_0K00800 [Kazachstania africana CBS 2517]